MVHKYTLISRLITHTTVHTSRNCVSLESGPCSLVGVTCLILKTNKIHTHTQKGFMYNEVKTIYFKVIQYRHIKKIFGVNFTSLHVYV